jgi:hypothetical protein
VCLVATASVSTDASELLVEANSEGVDRLLARSGALLVRGFPLDDTDQFARLAAHYEPHANGYSGGATPRDVVRGPIYEAPQMPASVSIPLHQDGLPSRVCGQAGFLLRESPESRGATTIGDVRRLRVSFAAA